jgi:hypothetical protein
MTKKKNKKIFKKRLDKIINLWYNLINEREVISLLPEHERNKSQEVMSRVGDVESNKSSL